MSTLVFADLVKGKPGDALPKVVAAAVQLGAPVHVLVAGQGCAEAAQAIAKLQGVAKVLVADDAAYANQLAEPTAALVVSLANPGAPELRAWEIADGAARPVPLRVG